MDTKFQQGKIYKIWSPSTDKIYIGSTIEKTVACRMRQHRRNHEDWQNGRYHYTSAFDLLDFGDASIVLLETWPCASRDELTAREQHHLDANAGICVNRIRARTTPDEARAIKNAHVACPCGGRYTHNHMQRHAETPAHQRYLAGEPPVAPYDGKARVDCECGIQVCLARFADHQSSRNHVRFLAGEAPIGPYDKKAMVDCACGTTHSRGAVYKHVKTKKHQAYLAQIAAAVQVEVQ